MAFLMTRTGAAKCSLALGLAACGVGAFVAATAAVNLDAAAKVFSETYVHLRSPAVIAGWQGSDSAVEKAGAERIVDADTWSALWTRHSPGQQAQRLDFSKVMAVVIFFGHQNSGFRASLREVTYDLVDLDIVVDDFIPDLVSRRRVTPYLFVILPRCSRPITIALRSVRAELLIPEWETMTMIPLITPAQLDRDQCGTPQIH
jgi:hypothetical protein